MSTKRKRVDLDLSSKMDIIKLIDAKSKRKDIADKYGIDISTISKLYKKREKITKDFHSSLLAADCKRMRTSVYTDVEEALLKWFKQTRAAQLPISGPMLAEIAESLAKEMGLLDWKCSNGFLERFKKRHNIAFKVAAGEAASVEQAAVDDWISRLPNIIEGYKADDIFNMDETGMFYKLLPDRTLCFRNEKCHGGKRAKDRLTAAVCCNMSGTEKWPLFVIGKAQNPRCFKNVKSLPVTYKANKRAWMTGELFTEWVVEFDKKMKRMKRKVLLFVDNCPAHADVRNLAATTLIFLPPNTTSVLQPCDQGIINAFKQQYRKRIVCHVLRAIEQKRSADIDVKIAIDFMHAAWNAVSQSAIVNCFRKSHFSLAGETAGDSDDEDGHEDIDDKPLAVLTDEEWAAISDGSVTFNQFVAADNELPATETHTVEEIAASVSSSNSVVDDGDVEEADDDTASDEPVNSDSTSASVSLVQSITAFETVRAFIDNTADVPETVFSAVACIQDYLINRPVNVAQSKITQFFNNTVDN